MSSNTIDDLDFPKAVLTRIVKASLPENIAIQKEARLAVNRASTIFVSYLAATANDCARESGHKIIMPNDVFKALEAVGLGDFIDRLQADLALYSSIVKQKKDLAAKNKAAEDEGDREEGEDEDEVEVEEDEDTRVGGNDHEDDNEDENKEENEEEDANADAQDTEDMEAGKDGEMASANNAQKPSSPSKSQSEYMDVDDMDPENTKRQRIE
ncbi:hypothetical protein J3B02_000504 [Coemansia erecta]|uniref:DNA polymerase epsilon subunit D n=1 Tax=Coemansia asiatica TaxID=1052880 RepID=A0A9W7XPE1_9FUNG|nr:hypothetical protein LPJ64_001675 [Coemansia asiatica]KAJ2858163.1 hypothetical protein J3B02_000504 [Coemansia erecta]